MLIIMINLVPFDIHKICLSENSVLKTICIIEFAARFFQMIGIILVFMIIDMLVIISIHHEKGKF